MKLFGFNLFGSRPANKDLPSAVPAFSAEQLLALVKKVGAAEASVNEGVRSIQEFDRLVRSYVAGEINEFNADFKGTFADANSEIASWKYPVRAKTRTLVKDTPQGKAIMRTYQNNVVGPKPFKLDMRYGGIEAAVDEQGKPVDKFVQDDDTNRAIEKFWKWFCQPENFTVRKTISFMEGARMVEGECVTAGAVLCRLHKNYPFNEINFAVDLLEEDRLQETFMGRSPKEGKFGGGNPIVASIEYHPRYKFPLAYWVLTRHPGNFFEQTPLPSDENMTKLFREQVPAEEMIHVNNLRDRAEQDLGMTELDAAVQPIWRNNQFNKALTLCAIASHIRAFVLEKEFPNGMEIPTEQKEEFYNALANLYGTFPGPGAGSENDPSKSQQDLGRPTQTLRPGQERVLPMGVKAKVIEPAFPTAESHDFRLDNHREVAIAGGISYQHASGDFQNLGFIAGLMCQIPFQDWCKIRQEHLKECWLFRLFREALRAAIMSGWFERRGFGQISISKLEDYVDAADFKAKRWAFVNPLVQAQTLILLMEAGIMAPQQVQDELPDGLSVEDLYTMIAEAKAEAEKHGLDFSSSDVTRPGVEKGVPGQEEPNPEGEEGSKAPAKSRPANPVRHLVRGRIPMETLHAMSTNGHH